ncbi:hypothetical protein AY599_07685 [Leptolyngbya valderiana BDU 20041]|uniref:hypothetical protein n=1 Tax=Baaleninema simplex TaxID=2862350 RepID=UPI00034A2CE1|nr:hypothetical protein [Baaleninema simplex]MDC0833994.1 hypothetical protein [Geitlerinema sp. CS-897]OAB61317.1 hypothetical protein AY599_07685 [Leptolyngbya valderiana BDU 20041]PPT05154.1 hypothetical protein CKA32_005235 [Geitlerinema sp. FC II]
MAYWIKINYERDKQVYIIDLDRIVAFSLSWNSRLTLYLTEGDRPIVLTEQSEPEAYQKVIDYIEKTTGYSLE